jgi:acyl-CoA thioesterase FadM
VDLLNRLGLMRLAFRGHWFPVLGAAVIRYHRPLKMGAHFSLTTRILGWDSKWFYLEQRFAREGLPVATALVKALVRGPDGSIPTPEVLHRIGIDLESPALPPEAHQLPE